MSIALSTELVAAPGPEPGSLRAERLLLVLHGVFGSGANWRSFMRALVAERPEWGFVLCDLRGHGSSQGAAPPHDLRAMADDVERVAGRQTLPVVGVVGHSLGGKVALCWAAQRANTLEQVWVLDAQPGGQPPGGAATEVLELLESLPEVFAARQDFTTLVEAAGQTKAVAAWLAMNVRRAGDELMLRLDLPAIRCILDDYYRTDMWPEVARVDARRALHLVVAGKSYVWREGDAERLADVAEVAGVSVHHLPEAGHWVNVDAPDALRALFVKHLP